MESLPRSPHLGATKCSGYAPMLLDTNWQEQVQRADWVIDTVGILFENPRKRKPING